MDRAVDFALDDAPPESGVRLRAPAPVPPARPVLPEVSDEALLAEVGVEVVREVMELSRALAPVQGAWLGPVQVCVAAFESWLAPRRRGPWRLSERWTELVPGFAAMDRLAHLMVDCIC